MVAVVVLELIGFLDELVLRAIAQDHAPGFRLRNRRSSSPRAPGAAVAESSRPDDLTINNSSPAEQKLDALDGDGLDVVLGAAAAWYGAATPGRVT